MTINNEFKSAMVLKECMSTMNVRKHQYAATSFYEGYGQ